MKKGLLAVTSAAVLLSCATPTTPPAAPSDPNLVSRLERFQSEAEFQRYVQRVTGFKPRPRPASIPAVVEAPPTASPVPAAVDAAPAPPPPPPPPPPPAAPAADAVVVTGVRASLVDAIQAEDIGSFPDTNVSESLQRVEGVEVGAEETITNVQTHGVDEGDIVKKIGHFLIVLQDGRLFTVDMRPSNEPGLAFVDRANVYRAQYSYAWYDEMLVYRNRIVVTGYSYANDASEINVFSMSPEGRLTREASYYMTSNDYYDIDNYATRLVDDKLVIYTPFSLHSLAYANSIDWPVVRRWTGGTPQHPRFGKATQLYNARSIYKPMIAARNPTIHSISTCSLGSPAAGDEMDCTAVAFIGPASRQFFLARDAGYLWLDNDDARHAGCDGERAARFESGSHGLLYRVPFNGAPGVMAVRGAPRDQMGLASTDSEFRALLIWNFYAECGGHPQMTMKYFNAPLSAFSDTLSPVDASRYHDAPSLDGGEIEERFTDDYVIYGTRGSWLSYPPRASAVTTNVVVLPVAHPERAVTLEAPHNVLRVERVGNNAVLTGYHNQDGLSVSLLDLSAAPRFVSTEVLPHRYESEGRSHAFNSHVGPDDDGLMGLPTIAGDWRSGRWWFNSEASDVSFLSLDAGRLHALGELSAHEQAQDPSYRCEVSCVDWYGNTRAIFTEGRVFALSGTELIEGAPADGRIHEVRRVNISRPPPQR